MKPISEWIEDDLFNVIPSTEFSNLEIKGSEFIDFKLQGESNLKTGDVSKAISAMANSGGGIIVCGMTKGDHSNYIIDRGGIDTQLKANGTKEWLENYLPNLVTPTLNKLDIQQITRNNEISLIESGKAVYVIEIPDSENAPHQALDNRYYGRIASSSKPLEHQWIMDILGRRKYPDLEISFNYAFINPDDPNHCRRDGIQPVLRVKIKNKGRVYANYVNCILYIPAYLIEFIDIKDEQKSNTIEIDTIKYHRLTRENVFDEQFSPIGEIIGRAPGRYVPILPGTTHSYVQNLSSRFNQYKFSFLKDSPYLKYELYADNAPCKSGKVVLRDIKLVDLNENNW
ncbi:MAG: hypothetical protein C0391_00235 [Anaerolinea sp.]|nr:hypothetical protein [Anaerolinea sp.]